MNVAVIGAGAFGQNHLRVYRELERAGFIGSAGYSVRLAAIVESNAVLAPVLEQRWGVPVFTSVQGLLHATRSGAIAIDAASVCVPTSSHHTVATELLHHGLDLLLEKPIAGTLAEADALLRLAESEQRILQVGHLERFNPAVLAVERFLNRPMFFEAHRLSVFTPRALDVDVVLDLMIHDLDIVLSFVRSPLRSVHAVGLPVVSSKVDIANVRLEFESGCVANFTASRVSTEKVRKLRFFQPRQYVSIDYARKDLLLIDVAQGNGGGATEIPEISGSPETAPLAESPGLHPHPAPGLSIRKPAVQSGEPLVLEIESFLGAVRTRATPRVTAHDGREALALALQINQAIEEHAQRAGLGPLHS